MALPGAVVHIRKMRCSIMCSLAKDIGIDLGTASVLVYVKGKGVVLNEPSVVAINKDDGRLLSVGADAQAMLGRTPGNIVAIRPLREGVISDYDMTERMLKEFIRKVSGSFHHIFKPRVIICVPSGITEVEERAVVDAGLQSGASHVYLIEEPVAAAIGAGIDITKPEGHMVRRHQRHCRDLPEGRGGKRLHQGGWRPVQRSHRQIHAPQTQHPHR